jgi:hypothetical protein
MDHRRELISRRFNPIRGYLACGDFMFDKKRMNTAPAGDWPDRLGFDTSNALKDEVAFFDHGCSRGLCYRRRAVESEIIARRASVSIRARIGNTIQE